MKTFYIYNILDDSYLGKVEATDIISAEIKAIKTLNIEIISDYVAAFSERLEDRR